MSPWLLASSALTLVGWAAWAALWFHSDFFPERAPIHWNINMEVDGWASRENAVLTMLVVPGIMTFILGLTWLLPRISTPLTEPTTRRRLDFTMLVLQAFFLYVGGIVVYAIHSGHFPASLMMAPLFVVFGLIGAAMKGIKQNPYYGVRTPWTLNDPVVWDRTHDFTAKLWVTIAIVGVIALAAGMPPIYSLVAILPIALAPIVASYVYSRK